MPPPTVSATFKRGAGRYADGRVVGGYTGDGEAVAGEIQVDGLAAAHGEGRAGLRDVGAEDDVAAGGERGGELTEGRHRRRRGGRTGPRPRYRRPRLAMVATQRVSLRRLALPP